MRPAVAILAVAVLGAGCVQGPILAVPPAERPTSVPAPTLPARPPDPIEIVLPRDDGPHRRLTEWWYYTGHLRSVDGGRWGFELVVFRAERGLFPATWASHFAVTDEQAGTFRYGQRSEIGPQVDRSPRAADGTPAGFDLAIAGGAAGVVAGQSPGPAGPAASSGPPWTMAGAGGSDVLRAELDNGTAIDLELTSDRPAALHDGDGWIDFGPAGSSYYYSRTRLTATGSITAGGQTSEVTGLAWFDHQWGDFISVGGGGWDWFAINLEDGVDITLSLVRDRDGTYPLVYGTLVEADGSARHLDRDAFEVEVSGRWRSPETGIDYPAGWRVTLPSEGLVIDLEPSVADQELDTRATTAVVYWEGSQIVRAFRDGRRLEGEAYVELTGYGDGGG